MHNIENQLWYFTKQGLREATIAFEKNVDFSTTPCF